MADKGVVTYGPFGATQSSHLSTSEQARMASCDVLGLFAERRHRLEGILGLLDESGRPAFGRLRMGLKEERR